MRFNSKSKKSKVSPKIGDTKKKTLFALFPRKVKDQWIWLEKYIQFWEYKELSFTEQVEVTSGGLEDLAVATGLVNSRYRSVTHTSQMWIKTDRELIKK